MQKFIISSDTLLKELRKLKSLIPSNPVIPILENFLFEIEDGILRITASDLQTVASVELLAESENLSIAISARVLVDTLSCLPSQPVTFSIYANNLLEILSDNGRYKIACEDAGDYPRPAVAKNTTSFLLDSNTLSTALNYTLFCVSSDDMKPAMNGVNLVCKDGKTEFAATDSHRLTTFKTENGIDSKVAIIIPAKALLQLKTMLPSQVSEIAIEYNDSNVFFNFGTTKIVARLIDEGYPDYKNVIPSSNDKILSIDRKQLLDSLKRVSIYANKTSNQISFTIANNNLLVTAEDVDFSNEAKENLPCNFEGSEIVIGFNGKFLSEMLANLPCDNVTFEFSKPNRAALLYDTDKIDDVLMLVMPVMLNSSY